MYVRQREGFNRAQIDIDRVGWGLPGWFTILAPHLTCDYMDIHFIVTTEE